MSTVSLLMRYVNGTCLVNIKHLTRFYAVTCLGVTAFCLVAIACYEGDNGGSDSFFFVALFSSVLVGMSSSMGEATFLGYCKEFPHHVVGFVSSGTGFAGISGTGTLLVLKGLGLSNTSVFLISSPTYLIYVFSARWLQSQKNKYEFVPLQVQEINEPLAPVPEDVEIVKHEENVKLNWTNIKIILGKSIHLIANLCSVYFFEYAIITCFADRMKENIQAKASPEELDNIGVKEFFVILNYCYQVGVFMSRSSLQYFSIKRVWLLSVFQAINFVFMFLNTRFMFVESLYVLCPLFIWVGLMGGASYVNVMHNILELESLKKTEIEACMVLSLMFNDVGIIGSAIFTVVMDNTLFKS